jgi:lipid-binding SYLF domain-containing protein
MVQCVRGMRPVKAGSTASTLLSAAAALVLAVLAAATPAAEPQVQPGNGGTDTGGIAAATSSRCTSTTTEPEVGQAMKMARAALDEVVARYQVDRGRIRDLVKGSPGFAVLTNVVKAGVIVAETHGQGFLVYRQADGRWGPPLMLEVYGTSIGPQIGARVSDVLVVFKTTESIRKLLTGQYAHGLWTSSGGVLSSGSETASLPSGIVTYSLHRGLLLGQSVDEYHLRLSDQANLNLYGTPLKSGEIIEITRMCHMPGPVQGFVEHVNTRLGEPSNKTEWDLGGPAPGR